MRPDPFQALPETVEVGGKTVRIDPSFRVGIAIEMEALSDGEPDAAGLLARFYRGDIPDDIPGAVREMLDFYRGPKRQDDDRPKGKDKGGRAYDFVQDAEVILSSFLSSYGIDLTTADLHWWTFRRLMFNLPHDCNFMQRVAYRTADLSQMSKAQKKHYKKMRDLYAIHNEGRRKMTVEERDAALLAKVERRYREATEKQAER